MDVSKISDYKICKDYRRDDFDFEHLQWDRNNPLDRSGHPLYPFKIPSSQGTSNTYRLNKDWFFKRKMQDGGSPTEVFSQHHFSKAYNELLGTFDDLAEVLCYHIFKDIIDPRTNKPLFFIPEYKLATYTDKNNELFRGCISKNVCSNNDTLITMSDIMKSTFMTDGNSIDFYMDAIEKYCRMKKIKYDHQETRNMLITKSYACWKTSNSDNHKNNIYFIVRRNEDGTQSLINNILLDNGSAYELCTPYIQGARPDQVRFAKYLEDDDFSVTDITGKRVFSFGYYPEMHNAFHLNTENLLIDNWAVNGKSFSYEYCLASEMLSNPDIFYLVYQIERQFDIENAFLSIDKQYGSDTKDKGREINWPPLLKEYINETNKVKTKTIALILADYYTYSAFSQTIEKVDRKKPSDLYSAFKTIMLNAPLQPNKSHYDDLFISIAEHFDIEIDKEKLSNIKFKKEQEMEKSEQQPS